MSLLGTAAVAIWCEIGAANRAGHDDWHSHEHLPERLGVPGFLRGRRGVAVDASARQSYFVLYEVKEPAVTTSAPYQARLNDPTEWSRRIMPLVQQLSRTLCRVDASFGFGVGAYLLTLRYRPDPGRDATVRTWLARDALPGLVRRPGLVAAHLLVRDAEAVRADTRESRLRQRPDEQVDAVVLLEGYDPDSIDAAAGPLADELARLGATDVVAAIYRTAHLATASDVTNASTGRAG